VEEQKGKERRRKEGKEYLIYVSLSYMYLCLLTTVDAGVFSS
jgi:hypothetical protein